MSIPKTPKRRLHLEITGDCNIACKYCYNSSYNRNDSIREELSFDEQVVLINQALAMGCSSFCFSGGEPFLNEKLYELIAACETAKRVSIITNASCLTSECIGKLAGFENLKELKISLDGFSAHDAVRVGSSHVQVMDVIREVGERIPKCKVIVNTMITKHSLPQLLDLYLRLKELNVGHWRIDMPFNAGRCVNNAESLMEISFEEIILVYKELLSRYFRDGKPMLLEIFNVYKSMIVDPGDYFEFDDSVHPCAYYNDTITVRPNGNLTYCPSLDFHVANWRDSHDLEAALAVAEQHDYYKLELQEIGSCIACRYLKLCGGGCRADAITWQGDQYASDPISCSIMPLIEEHIIPCMPENERAIYEKLISQDRSAPIGVVNFTQVMKT